jgi:signal transduction histidine kinase
MRLTAFSYRKVTWYQRAFARRLSAAPYRQDGGTRDRGRLISDHDQHDLESSPRGALEGASTWLRGQQAALTEQWLLSVTRDHDIPSSDRLTHEQLLDHLPRMYEELCDFLRDRAASLKAEAQVEGREHGRWRWKDGYRIDELVRELEAFRRIFVSALLRYRELDARFSGSAAASATLALHEFFAEMITGSVRQYSVEQQVLLQSHVKQLEDAHLQAAREQARLERSLSVQQRVTALAARRLAELDTAASSAGAARQLPTVLEYAQRHAGLARARGSAGGDAFDPRMLCTELSALFQPLALRRGLAWSGSCTGAPERVSGDRAAIHHVLSWLIEDALSHAAHGAVSLKFRSVDSGRWSAQISATGLPWQIGPLDEVFTKPDSETPPRQIGLAITTDLVNALGGSLRTVSRPESATEIELVLPVGTAAGAA